MAVAAGDIGAAGQWTEMLWVHAERLVAAVVEVEMKWDGADETFVAPAVRAHAGAIFVAEVGVVAFAWMQEAAASRACADPEPAATRDEADLQEEPGEGAFGAGGGYR